MERTNEGRELRLDEVPFLTQHKQNVGRYLAHITAGIALVLERRERKKKIEGKTVFLYAEFSKNSRQGNES